MKYEIPVNVVDSTPEIDETIEKMKRPKTNYFDKRTYEKKDYKWIYWFVGGFVTASILFIALFNYKYSSILTKMDEMTRIQEEMTSRTEQIKANVEKNAQLMGRYEQLTSELTTEMADKIKNKKQKVVEN